MMVDILRWLVLTLTLFAAIFDWRERRIPNFISLPALFTAFIAAAISGTIDAAVLAVIAVLYIAWNARWIGGGDAKLIMALSLAYGAWPCAIAVGVAGLVALALRRPVPGAVIALPIIAVAEVILLTNSAFYGIK